VAKYAYDTLGYWEKPLKKNIERVPRFGYDSIEFAVERNKLKNTEDANEVIE